MQEKVDVLNTVLIVTGPTAVGKTAIAMELARQLDTSIISADSRQCYKQMSIGTAKPSPEEQQEIKHFFIDEFSVTENLTAADFEKLSLGYLDEIFRENNIAVVTGGTGLYIKALCEGLDEMPEIDAAVNESVNQQYQREGLPWLQETVRKEDPEFFKQGEIQNPARLLRALIFFRSTGKSITSFKTGQKKPRQFNIIKTALELPREVLYQQINDRVDRMMELGLLEEVAAIYPFRHLKNLQTVGYMELFEYLDGTYNLEQAVEKIKQHTRNYAKRQLTWFKKDKEYVWLDARENPIPKMLALIQDGQR